MARATAVVSALCAAAVLAGVAASVGAQDFPPAQISRGATIYERNCAACHGPRMADPQGAANLRAFPRDEKTRFVTMVTRGRNNMPPWGDVLEPDDIDALWAYVVAGER